MNKRKSKQRVSKKIKNVKNSRRLKLKGGLNCEEYNEMATCIRHLDECLWKFPTKKCINRSSLGKEQEQEQSMDNPFLLASSPFTPMSRSSPQVSLSPLMDNINLLNPSTPRIIFPAKSVTPSPAVVRGQSAKPSPSLSAVPVQEQSSDDDLYLLAHL